MKQACTTNVPLTFDVYVALHDNIFVNICLCMAYLQKKKIRGGVYYYYTQTQRIAGKSQKVQQVYLGTPEQIFEKCIGLKGSDAPAKASHLEFGLPAALYQQALEIGIIPLINSYATVTTATLDVGQYLVLAAINPTSTCIGRAIGCFWGGQAIDRQ